MILLLLLNCKRYASKTEVLKEVPVSLCNIDSLIKWSIKTSKVREREFILAEECTKEFSEDSTFMSLVWSYNIEKPKLDEDEFVKYSIDLIKEKIQIPQSFRLKFDYLLNAYCPGVSDLPIAVNSEIRNLVLIDNESFTEYEFNVIRGRLESAIKYLKENPNKVTDTIYFSYSIK